MKNTNFALLFTGTFLQLLAVSSIAEAAKVTNATLGPDPVCALGSTDDDIDFPIVNIEEEIFEPNKNCIKTFTLMNTGSGDTPDKNNFTIEVTNNLRKNWTDFHFTILGTNTASITGDPQSSSFDNCVVSENGKEIDCRNGTIPDEESGDFGFMVNIPDGVFNDKLKIINTATTTNPMKMEILPELPSVKDDSDGKLSYDFPNDGNLLEGDIGVLSFTDFGISEVFGGIPLSDPILGSDIVIGDTQLIGSDLHDGQGWFFTDSIFSIVSGRNPVLTADLTNNFLFKNEIPLTNFDSEFQGVLDNIVINNTIDSSYLDFLENNIDSLQLLSVSSNILSATNDLSNSGMSGGTTETGAELTLGVKSTPEHTSIFSLLSLSVLGAASPLRQKIKRFKSTKIKK